MQTQEKHWNPTTKSSIKFSIFTKFGVKISKLKKKIGFIKKRPTSTKHQGVRLREEFNPYLVWRHGFKHID